MKTNLVHTKSSAMLYENERVDGVDKVTGKAKYAAEHLSLIHI